MWGQLLGTLGSFALGALKGGKQAPGGGGFTDNGWGSNLRPGGDLEPLGLKQSLGSRANEFLGSNVGKLATDVGGSFLGDFRARRNQRNQFSDLQGKGLTPWEIAGGGGSGAGPGAQGNTLGSGPATQINQQQKFQMQERGKDRALEKYKVDKSTEAALGQLNLSKSKLPSEIGKMEQDIHLSAKKYDLINKQMRALDREHKNFWAIKLATMSPDNVLAALLMSSEGVNAERVLKQIKGSPQQKQAVERAITRILATKSRTQIEAQGFAMLTEEMMNNMLTPINRLGTKGNARDAYRKEWQK